MSNKIVSVVGARPQFVKAAVVSRALLRLQRERPDDGVNEVLVHTGQHFDANMSEIFFDEMSIPAPAYHLGISGGGHGRMTGRMLESLETVLLEEQPDLVLVYGDTNSTLAAALAAAKLHIPVAHVEAGLRSFNRRMPEELNRVLTDHLAELLFAPTSTAVVNLEREGIDGANVRMVGDVMYDAALLFAQRANQSSRVLDRLGVHPGEYVLATIHRAENTDDPRRLHAILEGLRRVSSDVPVVLPMHPRARSAMLSTDTEALHSTTGGFHVIDPVGYLDMVMLEKNARLIVTDSGGVQKEAYFHRVACVTLRDETEWVELVEAGWNVLLSPSSSDTVAEGISAVLCALPLRDDESQLYGDGRAADRIAAIVVERTERMGTAAVGAD